MLRRETNKEIYLLEEETKTSKNPWPKQTAAKESKTFQ